MYEKEKINIISNLATGMGVFFNRIKSDYLKHFMASCYISSYMELLQNEPHYGIEKLFFNPASFGKVFEEFKINESVMVQSRTDSVYLGVYLARARNALGETDYKVSLNNASDPAVTLGRNFGKYYTLIVT